MDLRNLSAPIVDQLFGLAKTVAPLLVGDKGAAFIELAEKLSAMLGDAAKLIGGGDATQLQITRDELDALIAKVNAHADATFDRLKGD